MSPGPPGHDNFRCADLLVAPLPNSAKARLAAFWMLYSANHDKICFVRSLAADPPSKHRKHLAVGAEG